MSNDDAWRLFDILLGQSRASSSLLVALVVGIFTILVLYTQVALASPAWVALSIVYAFTCAAGLLIFRNLAAAEIMLVHYFRQYFAQAEDELANIVGERKIRKLFFYDYFADKDKFYLGAFIVIIILSILLWVVFAFQMFKSS